MGERKGLTPVHIPTGLQFVGILLQQGKAHITDDGDLVLGNHNAGKLSTIVEACSRSPSGYAYALRAAVHQAGLDNELISATRGFI